MGSSFFFLSFLLSSFPFPSFLPFLSSQKVDDMKRRNIRPRLDDLENMGWDLHPPHLEGHPNHRKGPLCTYGRQAHCKSGMGSSLKKPEPLRFFFPRRVKVKIPFCPSFPLPFVLPLCRTTPPFRYLPENTLELDDLVLDFNQLDKRKTLFEKKRFFCFEGDQAERVRMIVEKGKGQVCQLRKEEPLKEHIDKCLRDGHLACFVSPPDPSLLESLNSQLQRCGPFDPFSLPRISS